MLILKAKKGCKYCYGLGRITDWVDYGSTRVPMYSDCDCPFTDIDEETFEKIDNNEIKYEIEPCDGYYEDEGPDIEPSTY